MLCGAPLQRRALALLLLFLLFLLFLCRYVTFAIGVAAEVCALLLVGPAVDRFGRHNILALGQLLGGGACLACAMVKGGTSQEVLSGIGKLGSSGEHYA